MLFPQSRASLHPKLRAQDGQSSSMLCSGSAAVLAAATTRGRKNRRLSLKRRCSLEEDCSPSSQATAKDEHGNGRTKIGGGRGGAADDRRSPSLERTLGDMEQARTHCCMYSNCLYMWRTSVLGVVCICGIWIMALCHVPAPLCLDMWRTDCELACICGIWIIVRCHVLAQWHAVLTALVQHRRQLQNVYFFARLPEAVVDKQQRLGTARYAVHGGLCYIFLRMLSG